MVTVSREIDGLDGIGINTINLNVRGKTIMLTPKEAEQIVAYLTHILQEIKEDVVADQQADQNITARAMMSKYGRKDAIDVCYGYALNNAWRNPYAEQFWKDVAHIIETTHKEK